MEQELCHKDKWYEETKWINHGCCGFEQPPYGKGIFLQLNDKSEPVCDSIPCNSQSRLDVLYIDLKGRRCRYFTSGSSSHDFLMVTEEPPSDSIDTVFGQFDGYIWGFDGLQQVVYIAAVEDALICQCKVCSMVSCNVA